MEDLDLPHRLIAAGVTQLVCFLQVCGMETGNPVQGPPHAVEDTNDHSNAEVRLNGVVEQDEVIPEDENDAVKENLPILNDNLEVCFCYN
ncbi:unnamed protein product [Arabidopsis lyrata]|nr:unnamed protein product [Arabidopsis lyrata]